MTMRKVKSAIVSLTAIAVISANAFPAITASASTYYKSIIRTFRSSYNTTENFMATGNAGTSVSFTHNCTLSDTNYIYSKLTTVNYDYKKVYVAEWNKGGYVRNKESTGSSAGVSTSYNASFFTPTHTFHTFYSQTADYDLSVWYNSK